MKIAKKIIVSVLAAAMIVTGCPSHYVKADTAKKQVTLSVQTSEVPHYFLYSVSLSENAIS